jgi:hypothetical protein
MIEKSNTVKTRHFKNRKLKVLMCKLKVVYNSIFIVLKNIPLEKVSLRKIIH